MCVRLREREEPRRDVKKHSSTFSEWLILTEDFAGREPFWAPQVEQWLQIIQGR